MLRPIVPTNVPACDYIITVTYNPPGFPPYTLTVRNNHYDDEPRDTKFQGKNLIELFKMVQKWIVAH